MDEKRYPISALTNHIYKCVQIKPLFHLTGGFIRLFHLTIASHCRKLIIKRRKCFMAINVSLRQRINKRIIVRKLFCANFAKRRKKHLDQQHAQCCGVSHFRNWINKVFVAMATSYSLLDRCQFKVPAHFPASHRSSPFP